MNSPKKNGKTSLFHFSEKSRHIGGSNNNNNNNNNSYNKSSNNHTNSSTSCSSKDKDDATVQGMSSSVLRRERFIFDNVFVGVDAMLRLSLCIRQKTRMCLESARNLLIISLGCGKSSSSSSLEASSIEPPVSLLVGGEGGTGLISIVLDEVFRHIKPLTSQLRSDPSRYSAKHHHHHHVGSSNKKHSTSLSTSSSFIGLQNTYEQFTTKVILSAVIVSDGEMYDLLDNSSKASSGQQRRDGVTKDKITVRKRKSDGKYMLFNASKVQLQSTADFDRLIGLLLGRRSAMSRLAHTLLQKHSVDSNNHNNISNINSTAFQLIEEIDPWVINTTSLRRNGSQPHIDTTIPAASQASFDQAHNTSSSSSSDSMFISISACGGGVSKSKPTVDFNFVCPCGKNWSMPGEWHSIHASPSLIAVMCCHHVSPL